MENAFAAQLLTEPSHTALETFPDSLKMQLGPFNPQVCYTRMNLFHLYAVNLLTLAVVSDVIKMVPTGHTQIGLPVGCTQSHHLTYILLCCASLISVIIQCACFCLQTQNFPLILNCRDSANQVQRVVSTPKAKNCNQVKTQLPRS